MHCFYYIVHALWYLISLLPLKILYGLADLSFYPLYYLVRYRRCVVRKNLVSSFPEKRETEIIRLEKAFYHYFCDTMVETIKMMSMPKKELKKRMTFDGVDEIVTRMEQENKTFCFVYLGHYGNWEWIASLPYWVPESVLCAQIYHPLYNKVFDRLFLNMRNKHGGECIAMKETLRRVLQLKQERQKTIIGFISDQAPKWNSIHHWVNFLHHKTPVFIGAERIGQKVNALSYYADVERPSRGHWHCTFRAMPVPTDEKEAFSTTDRYMEMLEEMIQKKPAYWLWSHNRWKRTYEEWLRRQNEKTEE